MADSDPLLQGAVDLHVHGYPDVGLTWQQRQDDLSLVRSARSAGMSGVVLKSHFWPTMDRTRLLNSALADDPGDSAFEVYSSITLNPLIGGVQATTVEAAALHGASVVFMPTWGSRNDHGHGGVVRRAIIDVELPSFAAYLDEHATSVLDETGSLLASVKDVVRVCQTHDLVLSTGHLSVAESVGLGEFANGIGFTKLVFSHPFSSSIAASDQAITDMVECGATIELTAVLPMMARPPVSIATMHDTISRIGADHVAISSDVFFDWLPPHIDMLRMTIGQLRTLGMPDEELRKAFVHNPRRLLGLAPFDSSKKETS